MLIPFRRSVSATYPQAAPTTRGDGQPRGGVRFFLILFTALALAGPVMAQPAYARPVPNSFADLADRLLPAVVNISTTQVRKQSSDLPDMPNFPPGSPYEEFFKQFFGKQHEGAIPRRTTSLGSGFIIDRSGLIVTNNHVIAGADEIRVTFHDNTTATAKLIGHDPKTDIALLKVEGRKDLRAVRFGDSDRLRVGDWVLAIGNPFGFGGTVTAGIVSARKRDINAGPYDDFIQTDASINRGNSGGPLFDMDGEVVGINTAIISPSGGSIGIGFAVPSNLAVGVIDQLRKYGRTRRGWLGVRIQNVTEEIADSFGLLDAKGALVSSVDDDSPAAQAGIKQGDIILSFDNKEAADTRDLARIVAETEIGSVVPVTIWRDGRKTVRVKVGELKEEVKQARAPAKAKTPANQAGTVESLGLYLSPLTDDLRTSYGVAGSVKGVAVSGVRPESNAADQGLHEGDVILEVDQVAVRRPADVVGKVEAARKAGRRSVLLRIQRGDSPPRFVGVAISGG